MPKIIVNDINIYYQIKGQGEPIVLILGLAATVAENQWLIDSLLKKYRVLSFDNRGAGLTDKPDIPYTIEMMANDTACLMKEVNFNNANIIGISLGGRIALELILQHQEMIKKLILVSTSAKVAHTWQRNLAINIMRKLPLFRDNQPRYAFVRQMRASSSFDATSRLPEIRISTLILHGKRDRSVHYGLAKEIHMGITGSKMITFKEGHLFFMMGERPQFLQTVMGFLG